MANRITALLMSVILGLGGFLPVSFAHAETIDEICEAIAAADKGSFGGNTCSMGSSSCAANKACSSCVSTNIVDSQVRKYCASLNLKNEAAKGQDLSIKINIAPAATCAIACAVGTSGPQAALKVLVDRACTAAGIMGAIADISSMIKTSNQMSSDVKGWMTGSAAASAAGGVALGLHAAKLLGTKAAETAGKEATKKLAESCVATGFFALSIAMKMAGKKKVQNSRGPEREMVKSLSGGIETQYNSCVATTKPPECRATLASGMGGPGRGEFLDARLNRQAVVGMPEEPLIKAMSNPVAGGLDTIDLEKIASRIDAGESAIEALGQVANLPPSLTADIQSFEDRIQKGETIAFNGSNQKEVMASSGSGMKREGPVGFGSDEIGFGSDGVNPNGTAEEIGIDRAPAQAALSAMDGDIFHTGFPGTIFQIISKKLADSHTYVEKLEPVLPLNRALSGYKNETPKKK